MYLEHIFQRASLSYNSKIQTTLFMFKKVHKCSTINNTSFELLELKSYV
jgi:hypothetical protein